MCQTELICKILSGSLADPSHSLSCFCMSRVSAWKGVSPLGVQKAVCHRKNSGVAGFWINRAEAIDWETVVEVRYNGSHLMAETCWRSLLCVWHLSRSSLLTCCFCCALA